LESYVEGQIRKAQAEGAFKGLPGSGKPIADLDGNYDEMWWIKKLLRRENLSLLPGGLHLRKMLEDEKRKILWLRTVTEVRDRVKQLNETIRWSNARITSGPSTVLSTLDLDAIVCEWQEARKRRGPRLPSSDLPRPESGRPGGALKT
jgi:hypothetical protein